MMLAHPQMDVVFDFENNHVNTLVIENPGFFCDFLRDIHMQIAGYSGKAVLSSEYMPISFSKSAEIIDSFLSFDINRRSLITKVISKLESIAMDESNYIKTAQIIGDLEKYIQDLAFDLPSDVYCSKMNISGVLHSAGIEIADDYNNDLERLLDYMELTRELDREKLFVFVNLRSYYTDESVSAFLSSVLGHGFSILLVDSVSKEKLPEEKRTTVDIDLCEF